MKERGKKREDDVEEGDDDDDGQREWSGSLIKGSNRWGS